MKLHTHAFDVTQRTPDDVLAKLAGAVNEGLANSYTPSEFRARFQSVLDATTAESVLFEEEGA